MKRTHSSRGSILLLVIGLLTMVAMLGATFLIVARVNTRQIKEASVKNLADPVAAGVVASLAERLRAGLYLGDTGPYSLAFTRLNATTNAPVYDANSWKMFIDYPDPTIDPFLCQTAAGLALPLVTKTWTLNQTYNPGDVVGVGAPVNGIYPSYCYCMGGHTALAGNTPSGSYPAWSSGQAYASGAIVFSNNVVYQSLTNGNTNNNPQTGGSYWLPLWGICPQVDTDGDGIADAFLVPTGVVGPTGDRYYAAVKVTDTSGLLNLSVATTGYSGAKVLLTNPVTPINVDLTQVLGNFAGYITSKRGLNMNLSGLQPSDMAAFYGYCAQQLLNPKLCTISGTSGIPQAYAISEESYLACYTPAAQLGLLYWDPVPTPPQIANYSNWYMGGTSVQTAAQCVLRSHLTVWSGGRYVTRRPDGDLAVRSLPIIPGTSAGTGIVYDTAANYYKNQLYQQVLAMLNPVIPADSAGLFTTRKYAAASFTANLWYHLDAAKTGASTYWGFTPTNTLTGLAENFTAFAMPTSTDLTPIYVTEAYFKGDGTGPANSPSTGPMTYKAVELWNSLITAINTNTNPYYIRFGAGTPIALKPATIPGVPTLFQPSTHFTLAICSGGVVAKTGLQSDGKTQFVAPPTATVVDCSALVPTPDFTKTIQILKPVTVTINGSPVSTYVPIDQIDLTAQDSSNTKGSVYSWDMAKDDNGNDFRYTVAAATQITTGAGTDAVHSLGASNSACSPPVTFLSMGIGAIDTTSTPNRPAAAPYPVCPPAYQLTSSVTAATEVYTVPTVNTLGDLCEVYFCGPITVTSIPAYYPFSAMIGTNGAGAIPANFVSGFPMTDPVRGRLNFKGYPAWNASTTYPAGSLVVYNNISYIATATATGVQLPTGGAPWSATAGWPKNPTVIVPGLTPIGGYYPDVPCGCLLGEFLDPLLPDPTRTDEWRHYGRVNVNTVPYVFNGTPPATSDVLNALPWPQSLSGLGGLTAATIQGAAVEFVLAYRDMRKATYGPYTADYTNRATTANIPGLRAASPFKGYLTPSELAIPLGDLATQFYTVTPGTYTANSSPAKSTDFTQQSNYVTLRDAMYRAISNVITVRSDTFRANVYVELRDPSGTRTRQSWRYVSVIDRSNCRKASDRPAIVLFTEIR